ncbi:MAG: hypothetical protein U0234_26235 [Sandaracinus sp.]
MTDDRIRIAILSLALALAFDAGCSGPAGGTDAAEVDASTHDTGLDAVALEDVLVREDITLDGLDGGQDGGTDAGTDAFVETDAHVASACELQGYVCVTPMVPFTCISPDVPHGMFACDEGRVCCEPATGHPAPCEDSSGTCDAWGGPNLCTGRLGEAEIYLCPSGQTCCLPF